MSPTGGDHRLEAHGLVAGWDGARVVDGVDLAVARGEILAILGANGSGKSTLLWALAGLLPIERGTIHLDGRRVDRLPAARRGAAGLHLLPQTRRVFPSMTVAENLEVVEVAVGRPGVPAIRRRRADWLDRFPFLAAKSNQPASSLSGGEQQLLAIGRVLSVGPTVLLLDEPSAGLSPAAAATCVAAFTELAAEGTAVVVVEQDVALARAMSVRTVHMTAGRLAAHDPADEKSAADRR